MNRIQKRLARLTLATAVFGVMAFSAAPAMAAPSISYYQGNASASALTLAVSPSAIVNVDLSLLNSLLTSLPLGVGQVVQQQLSGTLANVNSDLSLALNAAHSEGVSPQGQQLATGAASTAPVAVNSAALTQEVALLKSALQKLPLSLTTALTTALAPILALPGVTAGQVTAVTTLINSLSGIVTQNLGAPSVNVIGPYTANLPAGADINSVNLSVEQGGLVTPNHPFSYGPFEAKAMPDQALGQNALTDVALIPTGSIGLPSLQAALTTLQADLLAALDSARTALNTLLGLSLPSLTPTVTGIINTVAGPSGVVPLNTAIGIYNQVTALLSQVASLGLNTLALNQVFGSNGSSSLGQVSRQGATVGANSQTDLASLDVLKLTNPLLRQILAGLGVSNLTANTSLVSVGALKSTASVVLDGQSPANQSASTSLASLSILGKDLSAVVSQPIDAILQPGVPCIISIPGGATGCGPLNGLIPGISGAVNGLITVTILRGVPALDQSAKATQAGATEGTASISALGVTVGIDCSKVPAVAALNPVLRGLPVGLSLCGTTAPGANSARSSHAAASAITGSSCAVTPPGQILVDLCLAHADAALGLTADSPGGSCTTTNNCPKVPGPGAPNTGSSEWILALLATLLVLTGAGVQVLRTRPARA